MRVQRRVLSGSSVPFFLLLFLFIMKMKLSCSYRLFFSCKHGMVYKSRLEALFKMFLLSVSAHIQTPHRSQEPQDRRVEDDDGSGRKVA